MSKISIPFFASVVLSLTALTSGQDRPNILFIYTDDQAKDECNFCDEGKAGGAPRNLSPTMDSLAAGGIAFKRFYVTSAACTPSRFGALTGTFASRSLSPSQDDAYIVSIQWNAKIDADRPHIASVLKREGYYTGFIGKDHTYSISSGIPSSVNADSDSKTRAVKDALRGFHDQAVQDLKDSHEYDFGGAYYSGNLARYPNDIRYHNLDWKVQNALQFFDESAGSGKPFFLHFATNITHAPYTNGTAHLGDPRITAIGFLDQPITGIMPARSTIYERVDAANGRRCWTGSA